MMVPDFGTLPPASPGAPWSWREAWTYAVIRPSVATFQSVASLPRSDIVRAAKWVALGALSGSLFWLLRAWLGAEGWQWTNVVVVPVWVAAELAGFAAITFVTQLVASGLGGKGSYRELAIASAAFYAPVSIAAGFAIGSLFVLPLLVYWIILHAVVVRAVHRLGGLKTFVAILPLILGLLLMFGIPVAALFVAMRQASVSR